MFIDEATIEVKGGLGGDGGRGGDVILKAHPHVKTLLDLSRKRHHKGERGRHGEGGRKKGEDGDSITLHVPIGTQIHDADTGEFLADFLRPGQEFIAARGGDGGHGNPRFVSSTRQAPRFAERGVAGEERRLKLALKILADVALIGLPNAGKSTLISRISAAKPKIANYPFTTLVPNLGAVRLDGENQFIAGDIPGLIRGAHKGAGLGHQFLKHIERAPVFVHLVDATQPQQGLSLWRSFASLNRELKLWSEELVRRPQLVAINKMDAISGDESLQEAVAKFAAKLRARGCEVFEISAATGEHLTPLLWRINELVKEARTVQSAEADALISQPVALTRVTPDKPFSIKEIARYADGMSEWEAEGGMLERMFTRFDTENHEAVMYVHQSLEKHGVLEEMRRAGVKIGDLVHVGKVAFAFEE